MKKHYSLLALVISITFIGGIFTGVFFSTNNEHLKSKNIQKVAQSELQPQTKDLPKVKNASSKVLIGYVQDFRDPNVVDYEKLTHVIFSFAHPTKDGGILFNGDAAIGNLRAMVAKAHRYDTKVMLAVGGWFHINGGESYEYFKIAISNPVSRTRLANELTSIAEREKLDGIDIDFEHPRSKADAKNLAAFTKELSNQLHAKDKELSIAVYSKIHAQTLTEIGFVVYEPSMFADVDHVNIMAYDGQWDGGYNGANLSPYPYTEKIVTYWTHLFETYHYPTEKLVLGVPLYAQPADPKIKQVSYGAIINKNPANANSDTVNMNGTTYYYNGDATMKKKTKLALENSLGGMMLWEAGLDAQGSHSLTSSIYSVLRDSDKEPVKYYTVKKD